MFIGQKVAFGVSPKFDFIINYASTAGHSTCNCGSDYSTRKHESRQVKLGGKYLISKNENRYISVIPSFYFSDAIDSGDISIYGDRSAFSYKYYAKGLEGQLLVTEASKHLSLTLIARAQLNVINKSLDGKDYGPYLTQNFGVRGNCQLSAGVFSLIPEIGLEVMPIINGKTQLVPVLSLGFGLQL